MLYNLCALMYNTNRMGVCVKVQDGQSLSFCSVPDQNFFLVVCQMYDKIAMEKSLVKNISITRICHN